ncbi:MAG TPA: response regulator [Patescibacteria group bacterium]|nr:response regulator [Patescibacteria group bacterium]
MKTAEAVLFVDDEVNILSAMRRIVMEEEFKAHFAGSGAEALKILEEHSIAVIITDMRMPGMDGLKLLRIVREKYPDTVRVVLSGYTQLAQVLATVNTADIFRFITKPWNAETDILGVIHAALEYHRLLTAKSTFQQTLKKRNDAYQKVLKELESKLSSLERSLQQIKGISDLQLLAVQGNQAAMHNALTHFLAAYLDAQTQPAYFEPPALLEELQTFLTGLAPYATLEANCTESRSSRLAAPIALLQLILKAATQTVAPELSPTNLQLFIGRLNMTAYVLSFQLSFTETQGYTFILRSHDLRLDFLKMLQSICQEVFHGHLHINRNPEQYLFHLEVPVEYTKP